MGKALEWFKAITTFIKDAKWVILWAAGAVAGWTGTGIQTMEAKEARAEVVLTQNQMTEVVNHISKKLPKPKVAPKPVFVDVKAILKQCKDYVLGHETGRLH